MDEKAMIEDLVRQLDAGFSGTKAVGHVNVQVDQSTESKAVETMGCSDCSRTPLACSVPTLHQGLEDYE